MRSAVFRYAAMVSVGIFVGLGVSGLPHRAFGASPEAANIFVSLSKKIMPSVVNISAFTTLRRPYIQGSPDELFHDFLRKFFDNQGRGHGSDDNGDSQDDEDSSPPDNPQKLPKSISLGTGFIIDSSGLILTNNHVVSDADEIKIYFTEAAEEKPTDGVVVGRDPDLDVALIKVKSKHEMKPVVFGDSDALEVGEYVIAVGNPFGQGHSVTHGIISAKGRQAPDFLLANYLQTDAPINPGNSGGPLVNLRGEVIGINNAIDQRAQGIGYAIPINLVKRILPQLRTKGTVTRGYIGVLVDQLTPEIADKIGVSKDLDAPFVTKAYQGQPAAHAGVHEYDVIVEFNGKPVHSGTDLINAVTSVDVGQSVPIKIIREGKARTFRIKVARRPGNLQIAEGQAPEKKKSRKEAPVETGMSIEDLTPEIARELALTKGTKGVVVDSIAYDGPADRAGVRRGDLILEVDRKKVKSVTAFYRIVKAKKSYLLRIRRMDPQGHELFNVVLLDLKEPGAGSK